jgi:DNA-binding Lrp family transcriptional regulator
MHHLSEKRVILDSNRDISEELFLISACILIRSKHGVYDEVAEKIRQFEGVKRIFPVLGRYDVVVDLEAQNLENLGNKILRMSRVSGVVFTETLIAVKH